ncbi:MAG: PIN domain-containing protein [Lentisphaerota bacterium]
MKDSNLIFLDSNLWIYLSIKDDSDKHKLLLSLIQKSLGKNTIVVSMQVINEVYWTLLRRYKIKEEDIKRIIEDGIY